MLVVVVLPWVPQTMRRSRLARNSSWMRAAMEVMGMRASSTNSSSGLPREMALPTTTRSGRGSRLVALKGSMMGMPSSRSWSDMGGYAAVSEPVTLCPWARNMPAREAIAVPLDADEVDVLCAHFVCSLSVA